jgi:hypothetical protein
MTIKDRQIVESSFARMLAKAYVSGAISTNQMLEEYRHMALMTGRDEQSAVSLLSAKRDLLLSEAGIFEQKRIGKGMLSL